MGAADTPLELRVVPVESKGDLASALALREVVFIEEQHVPPLLERDEDDARAYHVLAYDGGHAIGTGRLFVRHVAPEGERGRWGQIGRMAVLATWRRRGVGRAMLAALEAEARRRQLDGVSLHAQLGAQDFYRVLGYHAAGPIFVDAGIEHVEMRKPLWIEGPPSSGDVY